MNISWGRRAHDAGGESFEDVLSTIQGQGFRSIQLAPTKSLQYRGSELSPGYAAHLRELLDKYDIRVALLGSYFDLHAHENRREEVIEKYINHMLLASWAGFPVIGTETGHIAPDDPLYNTAFTAVVQNLRTIVDVAEKLGVCVAIEPVAGHTIYDADRMEALLEAVPSPNIRVIFDPVNLLTQENTPEREAMWQDFVDRLGHLICAVHIKDYVYEGERKVDRPAAQGEMDYRTILALAEEKPWLDFLIEAAKDEAIPQIKERFNF